MKRALSLLLPLLTSIWSIADPDIAVDEQMKVNLIELEVKVHDWKGNFVPDLKADDFIIREEGKNQIITGFDEIRLDQLVEADREPYQPRIMILLDFVNTDYRFMHHVFDQLRTFAKNHRPQLGELALAINADGIGEVTGFTADQNTFLGAIDHAEKFYRSSRYRNLGNQPPLGVRGLSYNPRSYSLIGRTPYRDFQDSYYKNQIEILAQFVRYVGAYSGKKNLIMISSLWESIDSHQDSSINSNYNVSLRDIQTVCLHNKVAINLISLNQSKHSAERGGLAAINRLEFLPYELAPQMASLTSGLIYEVNNRAIANATQEIAERSGHYYRIRYYSDYQGDRYRDLRVIAKGANRFAISFSGYFPRINPLTAQDTHATYQTRSSKDLDLELNTKWMSWQFSGIGKRRANYVISHRLYDPGGKLIAESVNAGELRRSKSEGEYPRIRKNLGFDLPSDKVPAKLETRVTDLTSGETVQLNYEFTRS